MTRAERLGLELGSPMKGCSSPAPLAPEVAHSIAISLKRIADAMERFDSTTAHWSTRS